MIRFWVSRLSRRRQRHRLAEGDQRRHLQRVLGRVQVGRGEFAVEPGAGTRGRWRGPRRAAGRRARRSGRSPARAPRAPRRSAAAPSSRTSPGRSRRSPPASTASAPGRRPSRRLPAGWAPAASGSSPLIRSCRRWTAASALSASALVPRKTVSWILAVRARRVKGWSPALVREHRAGVGERFQRPDQQRPLPVEEADRSLAVDAAGHRSARGEVVVRVAHWPSSQPV